MLQHYKTEVKPVQSTSPSRYRLNAISFVIVALFPFIRLVHFVTFPITYLWRPYQVVIWNRTAGRVERR